MKRVTAIVARRNIDKAIGFEGKLPWYVPEDLKFFNNVTTTTSKQVPNICIMGRKTYQSLGRPTLPQRELYVVTKDLTLPQPLSDSVKVFPSPQLALDQALKSEAERIFVCGGQSIYEQLIDQCNDISLTEIYQQGSSNVADTFFEDKLLEGFEPTTKTEFTFSKHSCVGYRMIQFRRKTQEEQYLRIAKSIIDKGVLREDRTGTGTYSIFGPQMEFNLQEGFPLLTTKRVFWRGVVEELLWFIRGNTDAKLLSEKNVKIWDGNSSRDFLDKRGLKDYREGDVGPVYGFQWRHWGADYVGCDADYTGTGIDQLGEVLKQIRESPESRRIIVSAWNVQELTRVALPSCHILFQYNVDGDFLDMKMYQRSADWFLGVPFNIASYALLLNMTAHLTGKKARRLILTFGDAHVYLNHREQIIEQCNRTPLSLPTLEIVNRGQTSWDDFKSEDLIISNYQPHPPIKGVMAV
jgi:dihydrofolate reductase/thymidylate synthase